MIAGWMDDELHFIITYLKIVSMAHNVVKNLVFLIGIPLKFSGHFDNLKQKRAAIKFMFHVSC